MNKEFNEENIRELIELYTKPSMLHITHGNNTPAPSCFFDTESYDKCVSDISKLQCPKCKELQDEIAETTKHYEKIIFLKNLKIEGLQDIMADISEGLDKLGDNVKELWDI